MPVIAFILVFALRLGARCEHCESQTVVLRPDHAVVVDAVDVEPRQLGKNGDPQAQFELEFGALAVRSLPKTLWLRQNGRSWMIHIAIVTVSDADRSISYTYIKLSDAKNSSGLSSSCSFSRGVFVLVVDAFAFE